jgi:3,4-dihydroxy 2-butanone 4-phosphate synthase/GTP cyclohydrolase II
VDDEGRENEGDLVIAADMVTPEAINFMATYGRGLICVPMIAERLDHLDIPLMVQQNTARLSTAFTVSVDVLKGATTGISVRDRAATVKALIDPKTTPDDLARPGHIFPLRYVEGGVLVRSGHTEASVDLARLAGLSPAAVICEVMAEDGTMARMPQLEEISAKHNTKIINLADLIVYRREHEKLIERVAMARLPTRYGEFKAVSYRSLVNQDEYLALVRGDPRRNDPTLVRVHGECLTGDAFGSTNCSCGERMELALQAIGREEKGVFLYLRQKDHGIGIHHAHSLVVEGVGMMDAKGEMGLASDLRYYGVGAQILADLGVGRFRLLANSPEKVEGIERYGLELVELVPIVGTCRRIDQEVVGDQA